jgi:hypothetical protein
MNRRIALIGLAAAVVLACTAPVASGSKLKTRSATATVSGGAGTAVSVTAVCPHGTRALGGGFSTALPNSDHALLVFESRRIGHRRWRASAVETDDNTAGDALTAYVNCRRVRRRASARTASASVTNTNSGPPFEHTAIASCPIGSKAIAGGFRVTPWEDGGRVLIVDASRRVGSRRWLVTSYNFGDAADGVETAYAYCRPGKTPRARKTEGTLDSPFGTPTTVTSPRCPGASKPGAGGFQAPLVSGSPASIPFIFESGRSGRRWLASGQQILGSSGPFSVFAYCS